MSGARAVGARGAGGRRPEGAPGPAARTAGVLRGAGGVRPAAPAARSSPPRTSGCCARSPPAPRPRWLPRRPSRRTGCVTASRRPNKSAGGGPANCTTRRMQSLAGLKMLLETGPEACPGRQARSPRLRAARDGGGEAAGPDHRAASRRPGRHRAGVGARRSLVERSRVTQGFEASAEIDLDYTRAAPPTGCPMEVESTVYRLVQEALTNVGKHAGATRVSVTVAERDGSVHVEVSDDGTGFESGQGNGRVRACRDARACSPAERRHLASSPPRAGARR